MGGEAMPPGPCERWHVSQLPTFTAWVSVACFAWQVPHVVVRAPECASWHALQVWWPNGAVACSLVWHVPHDGAATGRWAFVP